MKPVLPPRHLMRIRSILVVGGLLLFDACASTAFRSSAAPLGGAVTTGTLPTTSALRIDVGVSYLRLTMEARDSVAWSFETEPPGCASPSVAPGRLEIARRDQKCSTRWEVRAPIIDDVRVSATVGDIDVSAPIDRSIRLRSNVGSVRFRLDGRELRGGKTPGSGEQFSYGDINVLPRLDVHTNVGWIHAETRTAKPGR